MATASGRWAGGWAWASPAMVLGPSVCTKVGFSNSFDCALLKIRLQHCAFFLYFVYFHLFLGMCHEKHIFSENKLSKVKIYAYMFKDCLFLLFWTIISGSRCAIVTPNNLSLVAPLERLPLCYHQNFQPSILLH
jgi:hypothetical protein